MTSQGDAVQVNEAEVRRLYRLVLQIQDKIRGLANHAESQDDLKWARFRGQIIDKEREGDLRHLRAGNAEWLGGIFNGAVMTTRPLDEAPADLWDHIDAEINPLLDRLAHDYRALTEAWYDREYKGAHGTLRPEVALQLEPIMKAIAADVDAGRWP